MSANIKDVAIVGAGVAGLLAAQSLTRVGLQVTVLEKSRGLGGRLATRRFGGAVFDHGAQFFTARSERFQECIESWLEAGVAAEWVGSFYGKDSELTRYRGVPSMNAVGKHIAATLDVRRETPVTAVSRVENLWRIQTQGHGLVLAHSLLITCPPEQAQALFDAGGHELPPEIVRSLRNVTYAKSLTVMALLDGPSGLTEPGIHVPAEQEPVAWVADNQVKGISNVPCLTIQSGPDYALRCFDFDDADRIPAMLEAVRPHLKASITDWQLHRWRYAFRCNGIRGECLQHEAEQLCFAGDSFIGARVEGAALSGLAAGDTLYRMLKA